MHSSLITTIIDKSSYKHQYVQCGDIGYDWHVSQMLMDNLFFLTYSPVLFLPQYHDVTWQNTILSSHKDLNDYTDN